MTRRSPSRLPALAVPAVLLLAACGSSTAGTPSPTPAATASVNPALAAALTVGELSGGGSFTQKSDGLLGGTPNTDSRLFANSDGTVAVEVDLAADTGAPGAATDYPAYQSAAAGQVATKSGTPGSSFGQTSNEYVGTSAAGKAACSISFIEGRYIAVVTAVASGPANATAPQTTAEGVAGAQDTKLKSLGT